MTDAELKHLHAEAAASATKLYPLLSPDWWDEYLLTVLAMTQEKKTTVSVAKTAQRRANAKKKADQWK